MEIEEFRNLTIKEICNYIAVMNKLVEKGIIKFDKEKAYVEFYADKCISHLEKQNIELQQRIDKAIEEIDKYLLTEDYCSLKCENLADTFYKLSEILKGKRE